MSTRHYFYDTEFFEDGNTIELISIGIVCDDGREYYAVNSDMDQTRIGKQDWLCKNVIPHLPLAYKVEACQPGAGLLDWALDKTDTRVKPKWCIANEVRDFILESPRHGDTPFLWAYYGAYDHVALAQLFGPMINLPDGIPMYTHELKQLMETMPGNWKPPAQGNDEHNALADARWNKQVFDSIRAVVLWLPPSSSTSSPPSLSSPTYW